jgi:pyridoxine/pyridoxamine 5'-phosphate oxidase
MTADTLRSIVDGNAYMTVATSDDDGNPWASPVWYATADCHEFVWASKPGARHSRNLARRPELAIVIFDSQQPPGTGEGVYLAARAEQVPNAELDRCLDIYAAASREQGLAVWTRGDVEPPARHRLYRAIVTEHFVLGPTDERVPIVLP